MTLPLPQAKKPVQEELDFEHGLPAGMDFFPVWWLASRWGVSKQHVINLVESGEIRVALDLRGGGASKSLIRVPRCSVLEFLKKRKAI